MLGSESVSGLPTALFTLGSALTAYLLGRITQRHGRRLGIGLGFSAGGLGAVGVVIAAVTGNVALLFIALFVYGAGTATNLQARYAGTDLAPPTGRGRGSAGHRGDRRRHRHGADPDRDGRDHDHDAGPHARARPRPHRDRAGHQHPRRCDVPPLARHRRAGRPGGPDPDGGGVRGDPPAPGSTARHHRNTSCTRRTRGEAALVESRLVQVGIKPRRPSRTTRSPAWSE